MENQNVSVQKSRREMRVTVNDIVRCRCGFKSYPKQPNTMSFRHSRERQTKKSKAACKHFGVVIIICDLLIANDFQSIYNRLYLIPKLGKAAINHGKRNGSKRHNWPLLRLLPRSLGVPGMCFPFVSFSLLIRMHLFLIFMCFTLARLSKGAIYPGKRLKTLFRKASRLLRMPAQPKRDNPGTSRPSRGSETGIRSEARKAIALKERFELFKKKLNASK